MPPPALPPSHPSFTLKKSRILSLLSAPPSTYTDLSPKGSIDSGIRALIDRLNTLDGVVTTSSCAGRISVFLEGGREGRKRDGEGEEGEERRRGKGKGGKWLFVSHEPVPVPEGNGEGKGKGKGGSLTRLFGLGRRREGDGNEDEDDEDDEDEFLSALDTKKARFTRFQFEPMILHIQTSSLTHAHPLLTAAINAGFRESGIQSLPSSSSSASSSSSFPTIAIRSSGLGLGSVVGVVRGGADDDDEEKEEGEEGEKRDKEGMRVRVRSIVTEQYLRMLTRVANERFEVNKDRMGRFEEGVFGGDGGGDGVASVGGVGGEWENKDLRKARKRAEGLERRLERRGNEGDEKREEETEEEEDELGYGLLNGLN